MPPARLLISAAEASGDQLAAELLAALRPHRDVTARGVAGPAMRAAGVEAVARVEDVAVNGAWEVLGHLAEIRRAGEALDRAADDGADLLVVVDGPDFHLPRARRARARGVPVVGYVSPQVWAWRRGRVHSVAASLDRLLCLFPFEPALYAATGLDARWVGHPVVDRLAATPRVPEPDTFALLPGSRAHEIQRLLPAFLAAAAEVRRHRPHARFLLGQAATVDPALLAPARAAGVEIVEGTSAAAGRATAALVASGTATLELAVLGVPMVVAYAVNAATYALGRLLVRGVRFIALPNILADAPVVPEHIQHLDPSVLARDLLRVAEDPDIPAALAAIRAALGPPGASARAAAALLDLLL